MPEYPGYGIYQTADNSIKPSAEDIIDDALAVWNYFTNSSRQQHEHTKDAKEGDHIACVGNHEDSLRLSGTVD